MRKRLWSTTGGATVRIVFSLDVIAWWSKDRESAGRLRFQAHGYPGDNYAQIWPGSPKDPFNFIEGISQINEFFLQTTVFKLLTIYRLVIGILQGHKKPYNLTRIILKIISCFTIFATPKRKFRYAGSSYP